MLGRHVRLHRPCHAGSRKTPVITGAFALSGRHLKTQNVMRWTGWGQGPGAVAGHARATMRANCRPRRSFLVSRPASRLTRDDVTGNWTA